MNGYFLFRTMLAMVVGGFFLLVIWITLALGTFVGISNEISYRHQYGADWQVRYEQRFGPLGKARTRTAAAGFGTVAIPTLCFWLYKEITAKRYNARGKRKTRERHMSHTERTMRARSRALLWNYLGALGIAVGVLLVLFRWHIFADHSDEVVLGMFVFLAGYVGIISGCTWWLKAKAWSEAVVVIALWPIIPMFIPFVRVVFLHLLFASASTLLPLLMLMTPIILLVLVAVLPDKSGVTRKHKRWSYKDIKPRQET
jgi:hypothetical protein